MSITSTNTLDFWGPVSNFGIPFAAVMDMRKDPELISGPMTGALVVYAATFMRYSLAVTPPNYLLFACHLTNFGAQSTQAVRYLNHFHFGGKEKRLAEQAANPAAHPAAAVKAVVGKVEETAKAAVQAEKS